MDAVLADGMARALVGCQNGRAPRGAPCCQVHALLLSREGPGQVYWANRSALSTTLRLE